MVCSFAYLLMSATPRPFTLPFITELSDSMRVPLLQSCLQRASASASVFTRLYPDSAIAAAAHADEQRAAGNKLSPLAGLPVSIKDLLDVAGETTLAGSVVLRDAQPATQDAPVVARLRAAGAAIVGKTNMTEFAFSGVGLNPHYGTPVNPVDNSVARIPGGSSSGAAVSVAAGICVAAIGSDTGGSIRIPAALCGLVGFKPTMRRVPVAGTVPLSTSLDTICAITRSVQDCLLVDAVIADSPLQASPVSLSGLRLALPQTIVLDEMDAHVAATFAATLTKLSAAGAQIVELPLQMLAEARKINLFATVEAYAWHRDLLDKRSEEYDSRVATRMKFGANYSADDYAKAKLARQDWIARMEQTLLPYDAVLMPTVPIVAPPIADLEQTHEAFFEANRLLLRNPALINLLDGCAVSLPCHAPGSLPVGLMVAGPALHDARVMAIAGAIEAAIKEQRKN